MAWEENSRICLHMQLIAILSRIGVYHCELLRKDSARWEKSKTNLFDFALPNRSLSFEDQVHFPVSESSADRLGRAVFDWCPGGDIAGGDSFIRRSLAPIVAQSFEQCPSYSLVLDHPLIDSCVADAHALAFHRSGDLLRRALVNNQMLQAFELDFWRDGGILYHAPRSCAISLRISAFLVTVALELSINGWRMHSDFIYDKFCRLTALPIRINYFSIQHLPQYRYLYSVKCGLLADMICQNWFCKRYSALPYWRNLLYRMF